MRKIFPLLMIFSCCAYADDTPPPTTPATTAVSPNASVTIGQSSQQMTQIKNFFDHSMYEDLATPSSGINSLALSEGS